MAGKLKAKAMKHKMPNGKMMKNSAMMKKHEKMESKKHEKKEEGCE